MLQCNVTGQEGRIEDKDDMGHDHTLKETKVMTREVESDCGRIDKVEAILPGISHDLCKIC